VLKGRKLLIQINGNMKNSGKITGMFLMLLIAGNLSLSAQRGMRGMRPDSAGMGRMRIDQRQMPMMNQNHDSLRMGGMRHGMGPMQMNRMDRFMCPMCMMGNMNRPGSMDQFPGMGRMGRGMHMMSPGMGRSAMRQGMQQPGMDMNRAPGFRQQAPGMRLMENIPNLTDKQKKEIADLRQKQQDEMQKYREGMQKKMQEMRESNRTKIMSLLTDDQKKWIEENTPKPTGK
jgi:hypothetical protein